MQIRHSLVAYTARKHAPLWYTLDFRNKFAKVFKVCMFNVLFSFPGFPEWIV